MAIALQLAVIPGHLIRHVIVVIQENRSVDSKALGDEPGAAVVLSNLAELEFADAHPDVAERLTSEALETLAPRGTDVLNIATLHTNRAAYRIALGDI